MSYRQYTSINAFPVISWKTLFCLFAIFSIFLFYYSKTYALLLKVSLKDCLVIQVRHSKSTSYSNFSSAHNIFQTHGIQDSQRDRPLQAGE